MNVFDAMNTALSDYIKTDLEEIGNEWKDHMTVDLNSSDVDVGEITKKSFVHIKQLAKDNSDEDFLKTGLIKVVCDHNESKVDYILDNPKVIEMYQKEIFNETHSPNPILAECILHKKGKYRKNWRSRYLVLDRFGFLYTYYTQAQRDGDDNGMSAAKKIVKIVKIDHVPNTNPGNHMFEVTDYREKTCVYKADTSDEKATWIAMMQNPEMIA